MGANMKLAGAMTTATQSMTAMNKTMKPEQLSRTMQEFGKASTHMEMSEEMMSDALDDILNESGDEEAGDSIVQQVLDEIGIDISSKVMSYSTMNYVYYSYLDY
jgi:charged multivesicular body protein 2B